MEDYSYIHLCMVMKGDCLFASNKNYPILKYFYNQRYLEVVSNFIERCGIPTCKRTILRLDLGRLHPDKIDVILDENQITIGKNNDSVKKFGGFLEKLRLFSQQIIKHSKQ